MNTILNDPTRSGPPLTVDPGESLQLSRNEVEAVCTKAARGAGMAWGLAEEAGYAAGWLASRGIDGATMLARHLRSAQGKSWQDICPVVTAGEWRTSSDRQPLCPIALGATLSDHLSVNRSLFDGAGLRVGQVNSPVLILPFMAMAVEALDSTVCIRLEDDVVRIAPSGTITGEVSRLLSADCATLVISVDRRSSDLDQVRQTRRNEAAPVDAHTLHFLQELSLRTTVPSSAISRAGAGGAGSDND